MCQATCALCVLMPEEYCGEAEKEGEGGNREGGGAARLAVTEKMRI